MFFFQVSPAKQDNNNDFEDHVICIYTPDYKDKDEILRVDDLLRKAGVKGELRYKPTIFSVLGIYSNNKWRIQPSKRSEKSSGMYTSEFLAVNFCNKICDN